MSKSDFLETSLLGLLFNGTSIANLADNASASPLADLYVSLHTDDPGEVGDQSTHEADYDGYERVAVPRSEVGWTVTGNQVENTQAIIFPEAQGGSNTITHFAIGTAAGGAGSILYSGALTASLAVSAGIEPRFQAGDLTVTEE